MKLRIKGDSLRLRVSRSELERLLAGSRIEEVIHFGPSPEAKLEYRLESASGVAATHVRSGPQEVTVVLSEGELSSWSDEGQVGIYTTVTIGSDTTLEVAIEKDFACLDGSDEENRDTFSNPLAGSSC